MKHYQNLKKFVVTGDFCTYSPEGWNKHNWSRCCQTHDDDYSIDTKTLRYEGDIKLFFCVWVKSHFLWGLIYFLFVRTFGWRFYKKS